MPAISTVIKYFIQPKVKQQETAERKRRKKEKRLLQQKQQEEELQRQQQQQTKVDRQHMQQQQQQLEPTSKPKLKPLSQTEEIEIDGPNDAEPSMLAMATDLQVHL